MASGKREPRKYKKAADWLESHAGTPPALTMVLGSGFKAVVDALDNTVEIALADVPQWPIPAVDGHGGALLLGYLGRCRTACLTGRVHLYEGHTPQQVVRVVRSLALWGTGTVLLTNAAGGIDPSFRPGDLMVITDHLNLTGRSALVGPHDPACGTRFPDQSAVYDRTLQETLGGLDPDLRHGVYAGLLGPSYETPAEVRMLATLGAHAVGMSMVLEATALHAMGVRVAGLSLISNPAAGIAERPLDHREVLDAGQAASKRIADLLVRFAQTFIDD